MGNAVEAGLVVRLKSGGPEMTVDYLDAHEPSQGYPTITARCSWFERRFEAKGSSPYPMNPGTPDLRQATFGVAALEVVDREAEAAAEQEFSKAIALMSHGYIRADSFVAMTDGKRGKVAAKFGDGDAMTVAEMAVEAGRAAAAPADPAQWWEDAAPVPGPGGPKSLPPHAEPFNIAQSARWQRAEALAAGQSPNDEPPAGPEPSRSSGRGYEFL